MNNVRAIEMLMVMFNRFEFREGYDLFTLFAELHKYWDVHDE